MAVPTIDLHHKFQVTALADYHKCHLQILKKSISSIDPFSLMAA